jgi:hypothetical protein
MPIPVMYTKPPDNLAMASENPDMRLLKTAIRSEKCFVIIILSVRRGFCGPSLAETSLCGRPIPLYVNVRYANKATLFSQYNAKLRVT